MLRYTPLLAVSALSAPTCEQPGDKNVENGMSWYSCPLDDNAWYGISLGSTFDRDYAVQSCNSFEGGELISIRNEDMDQCAFYSMRLAGNNVKTSIWQSLFYTTVPIGIEEQEDRYRYCVNGTDFLMGECYNDVVEYTNWVDNYSGDNCAGLTLNGMNFVNDYGWDRENCASRHHFMCRVDCGEFPTPEPETTLAPTTVTTKEPATTNSPWEQQIEVVVVEGEFGKWQGEQKMCDANGYVCGLTTVS